MPFITYMANQAPGFMLGLGVVALLTRGIGGAVEDTVEHPIFLEGWGKPGVVEPLNWLGPPQKVEVFWADGQTLKMIRYPIGTGTMCRTIFPEVDTVVLKKDYCPGNPTDPPEGWSHLRTVTIDMGQPMEDVVGQLGNL